MENISYNNILFLKAQRMLRPVGVPEKGHTFYTRIRRGKSEFIPAKGVVLKEREKLLPREAKGVLKNDYSSFVKDLNAYFHTNREIHEMKTILEDHFKEQEAYMSRLRPLLGRLENLSEEENKFKTEFMAEGFKHRFMSYPRETLPYKDLFEESFKRLTTKMQEEVKGLKEQLKKVTAQEKLERVEKAVSSTRDKIEEHLRSIVRLKEEMVKNMRKMDASIKKSVELPKVVLTILEKSVKQNSRKRSRKRARRNHDMSERRKTAEPLEEEEEKSAYVVSIDEEFEKARVKPYTRVRRGKMERVGEYQRRETEYKATQLAKIDPSLWDTAPWAGRGAKEKARKVLVDDLKKEHQKLMDEIVKETAAGKQPPSWGGRRVKMAGLEKRIEKLGGGFKVGEFGFGEKVGFATDEGDLPGVVLGYKDDYYRIRSHGGIHEVYKTKVFSTEEKRPKEHWAWVGKFLGSKGYKKVT